MTGPGRRDPADGLVRCRCPRAATARDYLVVRARTSSRWSRSCGSPGAEGVAVNGERVTAATAIVDIGGSVLVNSAYLAPPYDVTAIGPADMFDRLIASPGFVDFVRSRAETFGIGVDVRRPRRRSTCAPTRAR